MCPVRPPNLLISPAIAIPPPGIIGAGCRVQLRSILKKMSVTVKFNK
jgi:hypothetical protein